MSINKIWIYDDDEKLREQWGEELDALGLSSEHVSSENLTEAVEQLESRRVSAAKGSGHTGEPAIAAYLDEVDVLIVDYDLLALDDRSYLTGENVAYLARTFSKCSFILAMNQYGRNAFDLTMKGHIESFADLNIGSEQLKNSNLWGGSAAGFNPWYWPNIEKWLTAQQQRVEQIKGNLDTPVFELLEFDSELIDILPISILERITPRGWEGDSSAITFREAIANSQLGIREKNISGICDSQIELIAAARISKWLERMVLPSMEYLIDAPHLALKFPSLFGGVDGIAAKVNTNLKSSPLEMDQDKICQFSFKMADWFSKPVWWMNKLKEYEELPEVSNPWDAEFPTVVFCEDTSTFCERGEAKSFVAELQTAAPQRWVKNIQGVDYNPSVRFAL